MRGRIERAMQAIRYLRIGDGLILVSMRFVLAAATFDNVNGLRPGKPLDHSEFVECIDIDKSYRGHHRLYARSSTVAGSPSRTQRWGSGLKQRPVQLTAFLSFREGGLPKEVYYNTLIGSVV